MTKIEIAFGFALAIGLAYWVSGRSPFRWLIEFGVHGEAIVRQCVSTLSAARRHFRQNLRETTTQVREEVAIGTAVNPVARPIQTEYQRIR